MGTTPPVFKRLLDFLLGREEQKEEEEEISESFKRFVKAERRFKLAATCAFLFVVFVVGTPMWYYTTTVYRAPFPTLSPNRSLTVPVKIILASTSDELSPLISDLMVQIRQNLSEKEVKSPLEFDFAIESIGTRRFDELENDHDLQVNTEHFVVRIALVPSKEWSDFSATKVRLGIGRWNFVQWSNDEASKCSSRTTDLIWEILIDGPHLNSIVKRDLRERMPPWQIATLPLSHQKRLVWDSAPLATDYHIQVIHVHENSSPTTEPLDAQKKTADALRRFGRLVAPVTRVQVTSEHLWDFDVTRSLLVKDVQDRWTLTQEAREELIKKVDRRLQTTLASGAVLRFVVLETAEPVVLLDHMGEDTTGFAVAAWGAILGRNAQTESRAIAAFRVQMGMDAELMPGWRRPPVAVCHWEIARARLRAAVDNAMRAASAIRALDEMTKKISNIVINDEVAAKATMAVKLLDEGLQKGKALNFDKLLQARQLADSANSDHSLLSLLYFPMDQRTAVIIPLVLPIVVPTLKLAYTLTKKLIFKEFL
ncbi:unnamed protein product [Caenorhabditis bovis]|uniref:GPI transamidase component PIG-S n=1 Tax=Caenorhabditis bovis TaxID=2654633 RepID=A0A8S1EYA1_9PELO|nr:unnamed protein product [Caenorhabditis bovis]